MEPGTWEPELQRFLAQEEVFQKLLLLEIEIDQIRLGSEE